MARKRGGLAGIWDRNKKIIKPIASGAGFLFGGPMGSAAVSGLMGGFDRPGKGGIGFDVGQGARSAAKGYLGGKGAQFLTGMGGTGMQGLKQMFNPQGGFAGMREIAGDIGEGLGTVGHGVGRAAGKVGSWAMEDPKNLLALGQTAVGGLNAYGQAQQNNMLNQQTDMRQRESDERLRIRALLMPYFQEYMANIGGRR